MKSVLHSFAFGGFGLLGLALAATPPSGDTVEHISQRQQNGSEGCIPACTELAQTFPDQVLTKDTPAYSNFTNGAYWAQQQQQTSPQCVFKPSNADQVAALVDIVRRTHCPFAIRSGGHGAFAGVSSIVDGITVSLEKLSAIDVSPDNRTVSVGVGNTWLTVYQALEKHGLAVPGGRYPTVGVGGLSLGGGVSFFANTRGWTCDNIRSYEVVLANATVVQVDNTSSSLSDLHWALRGGGNNFAIVTKVNMDAFPLPDGGRMWGGFHVVNASEQASTIINAAYNLGTTGADTDPGVAQIVNFGVFPGLPGKIGIAILSHAAGQNQQQPNPPAAMSEFLAIPALADTTRLRTLSNLSAELGNGGGLGGGDSSTPKRRARGTATFALNVDIMTAAKDICFDEMDQLVAAGVSGLEATCVFQVISSGQLAASTQRGGNALGVGPEDGPLFLLNVVLGWANAVDDNRVHRAARNIAERSTEYGDARGWARDFRYMNYAGEFQDVLASYGAAEKARLVATAKKYDPEGVFQTLLPGAFKLGGAPVS
ncbi:FAD binding domain-containing protein [Apodospora peruviana]|uniref:FAD binding domain-containing protein n=1 Tax=Apodospora peruviana TaxID=516989 RepID=A0AAE0MCM9_9PEZI|nr:FAD binding domain-containing protein [Apodospora peruviana]